MPNIVAIVGRPNVGKSTFFNRLIERRKAIVDETAGVTRDRHYGKSLWNGKEFSVIDTGGYVTGSDDVFESEIRKQVMLAIDEADTILFMVDVVNGITDLDDAVAQVLRKTEKRVLLVVNKVDNNQRLYDANEFYALGLGDIYPVSSINGSGTGDLLDVLVEGFPENSDETGKEEAIPRFAVIGRPNVGKSSFINALIGKNRNIVTSLAGTTRDTIDTLYQKYNQKFYLVDTAGLRKKGKVTDDVEFYSVMRSVRAIELSDVCFLLLDAVRGIESQDVSIFHLAVRNKKGIVVLVNKWDLIEKDPKSVKNYEAQIRHRLEPLTDIPVLFVSAITKQRIYKALETAMEVYHNRRRRISTSKLNQIMLPEIEANRPPAIKGKFIKIKYVTQLPTQTPAFAFFCNLPQYIKAPYKRYLENRLRKHFNFTGVPVAIYCRKK